MVIGIVEFIALAVVVGLILIGVLGVGLVGLFIVMSAGDRDVVSGARQGWIQRRSQKDEEGW